MAIINGYCTLAQLQEKLARGDDQFDDKLAFLADCITRASRIIDRITDKFYYSKPLTAEKLDVYADSISGLWITSDRKSIKARVPFLLVTSIVEDSVTLVENTDYYVYECFVENEGAWTTERKSIVFTGTIGYSESPPHIMETCLTIAEVLSGLGIRTVTAPDGNLIEVVKNSIPQWVTDELARERNYRV